MPIDYMLLKLWAFDGLTDQELWNVNLGEQTAVGNFATGIVDAHDGGLTFFGFTDNNRLRFIKTDSYGFVSNE